MPWYKFEASHGPGHQSHLDKYEWWDEAQSPKELEQWWEWWTETEQMDWPVGTSTLVEELSAEVRLEKVGEYQDDIAHARHMLQVLGEMAVHPEADSLQTPNRPGKGG